MAAADGIQVVARRRIGARYGGLHAALRHHRIGITHAQLGGDDRAYPVLFHRDQRGVATGATAADDQQVGLEVRFVEIHLIAAQPGVRLQQVRHLGGQRLVPVGADAHRAAGAALEIGVKALQHSTAFLSVHRRIDGIRLAGEFQTCRTRLSHFAERLRHVIWIHLNSFLFRIPCVIKF